MSEQGGRAAMLPTVRALTGGERREVVEALRGLGADWRARFESAPADVERSERGEIPARESRTDADRLVKIGSAPDRSIGVDPEGSA